MNSWAQSSLVAILVMTFPALAAAGGDFKLESVAFDDNKQIPVLYTCEGKKISPPLSFSDPPKGTKSLVLIISDPDAPDPKKPKLTWVHWVLYNIPPTAKGLAQNIKTADLPAGTLQGKNSWKKTGYGGPCPPIGRHRYFHRLFALDRLLPDLHTPTRAVLLKAIEGHLLGKAELVGTYQKKKKKK
jgi:Raf kinase inhibitor-like YbhB/YbcL family protein